MAHSLKRDEYQRTCGYLELDTSQGAGKAYERYFFALDTQQNKLLYYSEDPKVNCTILWDMFGLLYL